MSVLSFFRRRQVLDVEATLEEAFEALRSGDAPRAVGVVEELERAVVAEVGEDTAAHGDALFRAASVYFAAGLESRAIDALQRAARVKTTTWDEEKDRLTYLMNLGDFLTASGRLDEAIAAHRRGVVARAEFYGEEHPGFGFGLDSLATSLLAAGEAEEALAHASCALEIFNAQGHERAPRALAVVLFSAVARGQAPELSGQLDAVAEEALTLVRLVPPSARARGLALLAGVVQAPALAIELWSAVSEAARQAGDARLRLEALQTLQRLAPEEDARLQLDTRLALALAHDQEGDLEAARAAYEEAVAFARSRGEPGLLSSALRNAGLFLVNAAQDPAGRALLEEACALSDAGDEERGRALGALGIHLQHQGELAAADTCLADAVALLAAAHPDAVTARSHLDALRERQSCGCGDQQRAIAEQLLAVVEKRLPGLVQSISLDDTGLHVEAARPLSSGEARALRNLMDLAVAELRQQTEKVYGP